MCSIHCVASTLGGQRCCKAFGGAFAELCTEPRAGLLQGFGRAQRRAFAELLQSFCRAFAELLQSFCRALVELKVLKFVTWILPKVTARGFVFNQLEAGLAGV